MPKSIKIAPLWQQKLAVLFIKTIGLLPKSIGYSLANGLAWLTYQLMSLGLLKKKKHIAKVNFQFALPDKDDAFYEQLLKDNIQSLFRLIFEFCKIWTLGAKSYNNQIETHEDESIFDNLRNKQSGVLLITPHLGNWELFGLWMAQYFGMNAMFKPSSMPLLDELVQSGREQYGGKIITADVKGVVRLMKLLKQQEIVLRLPDHKPKEGGVVVDFLNHPAYSETLNAKLIQKLPDTEVMVGAMVRSKQNNGFKLVLKPIEFEDDSIEGITLAINTAMSELIYAYPEQYHWFYERFRHIPGLKNPYR